MPVLRPVIRTSQTGRSARGPRCLLDRVDSSALSSRVIFPSARSPNITLIASVVAHELLNQRKSAAAAAASMWGSGQVWRRRNVQSFGTWAWIKLSFFVHPRIREWCKLLTGCSQVDSHLFLLWATATSCFYRETLVECKKAGLTARAPLLSVSNYSCRHDWIQVCALSHCRFTICKTYLKACGGVTK